jgi:hypothetical protein
VRRRRRLLAAALALVVSSTLAVGGPSHADPASVGIRWSEVAPSVRVGDPVAAVLEVGAGPGTAVVELTATGARFTALPVGCTLSSVIHERSSISADGSRLRCLVQPRDLRLSVPLVVTAPFGEQVAVAAATGRSGAVTTGLVSLGGPAERAAYRFLSSPDFLNADVGDLRRGPTSWSPSRSENSINQAYRTALDHVLDAFQAERAGSVLVAGDLVEGHWHTDKTDARVFGPVATHRDRKQAIRRAAATYYPQWLERFRSRGLSVLPAIGDHELGDNPWRKRDRALVPTYQQAWARYFARRADGSPRWKDRPRGSRHEMLAYAVRPVPELQLVTLDVLDITAGRTRIQVDRAQLAWLRGVLDRARRDGVPWIVVQGHAPVLAVPRSRGSSGLQVEGGHRSALWRTFREYGVDLYLAGEVHDVSTATRDGVVQVTHGGMFQYGLTNYLRADVHADRLELQLRDFDVTSTDAPDGSRLWQTRPSGIPKVVRVDPEPFTIGTMTLDAGGLRESSGVLRPIG